MTVEYAPHGLIGVLTPQANTTVEPEFWLMLPPGVAMINARMTSDEPSLEARLIDYFDQIDQTIAQFHNAPVGAIAFATTGASYSPASRASARWSRPSPSAWACR